MKNILGNKHEEFDSPRKKQKPENKDYEIIPLKNKNNK